MRAYSPTDILSKKYKQLDWSKAWVDAYARPETTGLWFVWGNSGNGKSSFMMQLTKELAHFGKVFFNALEEGNGLTMQENLLRTDITAVKRNVLIGCESMEDLDKRLLKRKAPKVIIIDSFQHTGMSIIQLRKFIAKHPDKLFIFTSQTSGTKPDGRAANAVKHDASLKIWVEGFRAISHGRYNMGGYFTIWEAGATKYWGEKTN